MKVYVAEAGKKSEFKFWVKWCLIKAQVLEPEKNFHVMIRFVPILISELNLVHFLECLKNFLEFFYPSYR